MNATVHQLVPSAVPGDATTAHTLQLKRLLEEAGHRSEIYAIAVHRDLEGEVRLIGELSGPSRPDAFLIYQFSAYSPLADTLLGRRERIALNYHNITPASFFRRYDRGIELRQLSAEVQVSQLARATSTAVCDSRFNAQDIRERGFSDTAVAPILLDLAGFEVEPDPVTETMLERRRQDGGAQFLNVGGMAPHKAQHDLVIAFAEYRRVFDKSARLSLVGRTMSPGYAAAVKALVGALGLADAVDLVGEASHEQLVAYYRDADVLVSVSEHEGFCVPLLEAMYFGLPVVAYRAGAVADTLGEAGLLMDDKSPATLAGAMWRVASDRQLGERLARDGSERVEQFSLSNTRAAMRRALEPWLAA